MKKFIEIGKVVFTLLVLILLQIIQDHYFVNKSGLHLAFPPALIPLIVAGIGAVGGISQAGIKARQAKKQITAERKKKLIETAVEARKKEEEIKQIERERNNKIIIIASISILAIGTILFFATKQKSITTLKT